MGLLERLLSKSPQCLHSEEDPMIRAVERERTIIIEKVTVVVRNDASKNRRAIVLLYLIL
eukprot:scaffold10660_cov176-Amphora_coffeaeformis.AAC.4